MVFFFLNDPRYFFPLQIHFLWQLIVLRIVYWFAWTTVLLLLLCIYASVCLIWIKDLLNVGQLPYGDDRGGGDLYLLATSALPIVLKFSRVRVYSAEYREWKRRREFHYLKELVEWRVEWKTKWVQQLYCSTFLSSPFSHQE